MTTGSTERGSALVLALLLLVSLSIMGMLFVNMARTESQIVTNQNLGEKALYLAEVGWRTAYQEFAMSNFTSMTHNADGSWPPAVMPMATVNLPGLVLDDGEDNGLDDERNDGEWVWEWEPGDGGANFSGTEQPESFRFRVYPASAAVGEQEFVIAVDGRVGTARRTVSVGGFTEPAFTYTFFADTDLGEFTRGVNQTVTGRIHANGDVCFAPDGSTLNLDVTSITATGDIFRYRDLWGRSANAAGVVNIKDGLGVYRNMVWGTLGNAFDSFHANWENADTTDGIQGAVERWRGVVRDGALGAGPVTAPGYTALLPGGYYQSNSTLRLYGGDMQRDAMGNDVSALVGSAVRQVTFYNPSTGVDQTVQEIDVADLQSRGLLPPNGVIYCQGPMRIRGADSLGAPLTFVASDEVYTFGDFNARAKKAAAIMSTGRIWHLSNAWNDGPSYTHNDRSVRQATNGTTTVNAAMMDGVPAINEANYADLNEDGVRDGYPGTTWANSDFLLETWGGSRTLRKRGSVVHLGKANMSDDPTGNSLDEESEVAWQRYQAYSPPYRDYGYDASLMGLSGQPPLAPRVSHISSWQEANP